MFTARKCPGKEKVKKEFLLFLSHPRWSCRCERAKSVSIWKVRLRGMSAWDLRCLKKVPIWISRKSLLGSLRSRVIGAREGRSGTLVVMRQQREKYSRTPRDGPEADRVTRTWPSAIPRCDRHDSYVMVEMRRCVGEVVVAQHRREHEGRSSCGGRDHLVRSASFVDGVLLGRDMRVSSARQPLRRTTTLTRTRSRPHATRSPATLRVRWGRLTDARLSRAATRQYRGDQGGWLPYRSDDRRQEARGGKRKRPQTVRPTAHHAARWPPHEFRRSSSS